MFPGCGRPSSSDKFMYTRYPKHPAIVTAPNAIINLFGLENNSKLVIRKKRVVLPAKPFGFPDHWSISFAVSPDNTPKVRAITWDSKELTLALCRFSVPVDMMIQSSCSKKMKMTGIAMTL